MLKTLKEIFKKEDLLDKAYAASIEMLKIEHKMFLEARASLRESDTGVISKEVYAMDKKVNEYQREIRRQVLAHMIATQRGDLVFGLTLVSIVIDIERIGDYIKNIVDLAKVHHERLTSEPLEKELAFLGKKVRLRFEQLIEAFETSNVDIARSVMRDHKSITKKCDMLVESLMKDDYPELPTKTAVGVALYVRYLKRISSHITNVASGIVNPFDRIGFTE